MARNVGILNRVKNKIPMASLKTLYSSLIFPHYSYCLEVWGACQSKFSKRIKGIQKNAIRTVFRSHYLSHTEPRMRALNILKFEDQYQYQCLTLLFNMLKGYSPDVYNLKQNQNENARTNALRSNTNRPDNLRLPSFQASQSTKTFLSSIPVIWNKLPTDLQCATSQSIFKSQLKLEMISKYEELSLCANPMCIDSRYHVG